MKSSHCVQYYYLQISGKFVKICCLIANIFNFVRDIVKIAVIVYFYLIQSEQILLKLTFYLELKWFSFHERIIVLG